MLATWREALDRIRFRSIRRKDRHGIAAGLTTIGKSAEKKFEIIGAITGQGSSSKVEQFA